MFLDPRKVPSHRVSLIAPHMLRLVSKGGVEKVDLDMCQFGLCDPVSGVLFFCRKSTRLIGRLPGLETIGARCDGQQHVHQHVEDSVVVHGQSVKRSKLADEYPSSFCITLAKLVRAAVDQSHRCRLKRHRLNPLV